MANEEHLKILKQGVEAWNKWREENPDIRPDFYRVDFSGAPLRGIDLAGADLSRAELYRADLRGAILIGVEFGGANLIGADLDGAVLIGADLDGADFSEADLSGADLIGSLLDGADFSGANLSGADLEGAVLIRAFLHGANLSEVYLSEAIVGWTTFGDVDLSTVKGLDTIEHSGPSIIGIDTIYKSKGNIPESFLRGAGVPDNFIKHMHLLTDQAIKYHSCFISYSSSDEDLAQRLYDALQSAGVRCWFAPEDMKIGDPLLHRIDESIRMYEKLLIILSENAIASEWVDHEVQVALAKERSSGGHVLFPIRVDDAVIESEKGWAATVRDTRHIGDFTEWRDHDAYQEAFDRLLRDLKAEE